MFFALFYLLGATALLIPADTSLDADLQVCLSCWQGLCSDDSSYNADSLCPCPCINSTLSSSVTKCGVSNFVALPNPQCCSKANASFVSKFVSPVIEMIPPNLTNPNTCPGAYNEPANFVLSSYEEIASTKLNREYLYHDTPFTCSGCISSVTIYHKVGFNADVSIDIQLWRPSVNITDNTTNVLQAIGQEMNVTFRQDSSQGRDNGNYYTTNSILSSSELCFKPGDMYGVYLPSEFSAFNILEEKDKDTPPNNQLYYIYYRERPSCPSSGKYFFLNEKDAKPLIVVSVTSAVPTPSFITNVFTSLLFSQSTISTTMITSSSANVLLVSSDLIVSIGSSRITTQPIVPSTASTSTVSLPASVSSAVIGGIVAAAGFITIACLVITSLIIIASIVKKRAHNVGIDLPSEISHTTVSAISNIEDNPAYVTSRLTGTLLDNPAYESTTKLNDNPAYESATKLNDNPAYGSRSTDNPVCASTEYAVVEVSYAYPDTSNIYDTAEASPDQDDNEYASL